MATPHTVLVKVYHDGAVEKTGTVVDYAGPPDWKFQPVDPVARAKWEEHTADPPRVDAHLKLTGEWDYGAPPPAPRALERGYTAEVVARMQGPRRPAGIYDELAP